MRRQQGVGKRVGWQVFSCMLILRHKGNKKIFLLTPHCSLRLRCTTDARAVRPYCTHLFATLFAALMKLLTLASLMLLTLGKTNKFVLHSLNRNCRQNQDNLFLHSLIRNFQRFNDFTKLLIPNSSTFFIAVTNT